MKHLFNIIYRPAYNGIHNDAIENAGYLAFLGLLAFFPFLVLLVSIAGILGQGNAGKEFIDFLFGILPPNVVYALKPRINEIVTEGPSGSLVTISIIGAIWTSSSFVEGFRTVLNRAYHVTTPPNYWLRRLVSIGQLFIFTIVIIIGTGILVFEPIISAKITNFLGLIKAEKYIGLSEIFYIFAFLLLLLTVSLMYYILPNVKLQFFEVLPGAIITVAFWDLAALGLSNYLASFDGVNIVYGSLAGVIAALIFLYLINIIFIYGAEANYYLKKNYYPNKRIFKREKSK